MKTQGIALALLLAGTIGAGAKPVDPLGSFAFMIGSWNCSYTLGAQTASYNATMSWAIGGKWIRERDSWAGGAGDEGLFTYDRTKRQWTEVVIESQGPPTLFVAGNSGSGRIAYRSVYPDASMTDTIDRISPVKYTIHFTQTAAGKTTHSVDVCTKR